MTAGHNAGRRPPMATCSACGNCCDPVPFTREQHEIVTKWSGTALQAVPDPRTDEGWEWWTANGWEYGRDAAASWYDPEGRHREDADFIAAHWTPGDDGCTCDAFDPVTRLCTMQDGKPPVCRDYPWYSDGPTAERAATLLPGCSYLADVPIGERPEGARPLIPVTVV